MVRKRGISVLAIRGLAIGAFFMSAPMFAQTAVEQGRILATSGSGAVLACVTCHGAKGEGMAAAGFPYLAGQGASYLDEQLQEFSTGARSHPVMAPIAKAMNRSQMQAAAAYYASLAAPFDAKALSGHLDTYPAKDDAGAWLANRGDWSNNIPACIQCHGPGGVGESFPAVAGQPAAYLREQLLAWKQGKRGPGPLDLMGDIAKRMNEAQITAVADYFAGLPQAVKAGKAPAEGAK